ncbi:MAG: hypothetical protein IPL84_13525 [Chitinophagaceae bacterium]|nr:hypothetical protein [Chitinophagaceae bacterium]
MMLSEKEKEFINYWEKEREKQSSVRARLIAGLPMAVLFCAPILLFITAVYLFLPEWYTKVSSNIGGSMWAIVMALVICVLFISYFRMQFKWESNEQYYRELKNKEGRADSITNTN